MSRILCALPFFNRRITDDQTRFNGFLGLATNILQLDELNRFDSGTSRVPGLAGYVSFLRQWNQLRKEWMERADRRLEAIRGLGKQRMTDLFRLLYAEQIGEHEDGTVFDGWIADEVAVSRYGFDEEMASIREGINSDFRDFITQVEQNLLRDARRRFRAGSPELTGAVQKIQRDFEQLRAKPYFPLMRFGKYTLTLRDAQGNIARFEQYEKRHERDRAFLEAKRAKRSDESLHAGMLTDQVQAFQGMPPAMAEMIAEQLGLTESQRADLQNVLHKMAPGQSFRKQLIQRKGVRGFAEDGMRTYASYFMHGANHLGRITYSTDLQEQIRQVQEQGRQQEDSTRLDGIREMMSQHLDYILNPRNELANLRAWAFMWYLGFMPKAAFVNFTQVPLVTYPYLAARYGDVGAVREIGRASKDVFRGIFKDSLPKHEVDLVNRLMAEGLIDQSFATMLAAVSNGSYLSRALASTPRGEFLTNIAGKGAWMFSIAEMANRRVTALSAFRLSLNQMLDERGQTLAQFLNSGDINTAPILEEAYRRARHAIEHTQFEYSDWNRPMFMRGRKSLFFVFMQYVQNMLFFLARDKGNTRLLGMLFLAAGLQGLPFAEDLLDLLDALLSSPNHKVNTRKELREFMEQLNLNPDFMMLGGAHSSFGLGWLGEQIGLPIPEVDLQRSVGMGSLIPGFEPATELLGGLMGQPIPDFSSQFMQLQEGALGAAVAVPMNLLRAAFVDTPHTWKRLELAMPAFARSISRSARYATEGEETTLRGVPVATFDRENSRDTAAIMLQALGFTPRAVSKGQTLRAVSKEVEVFYSSRRSILLGDLDWAYRVGDREGITDTLKAITQYNRDVPYPELGIRRKDITVSRRRRRRTRLRQRAGLPLAERYERAVQEERSVFDSRYTDEGIR